MTKKIISLETLSIIELEQKIAPSYLSDALITDLEAYLGYDYDPEGIIEGSYVPPTTNTLWDSTVQNMENYLGFEYRPMDIIDGTYFPY